MASFDKSTPFMLLARIHVKPGCVDQYLELARVTDEAVQASEPGMIHHTFDQDPEDPQAFVWSEVYGTVGDECRQLMESFGLPLKIFETKLGYSRV